VAGREETFLYLAQHRLRHLLVFGDETARDPVRALRLGLAVIAGRRFRGQERTTPRDL
jgi:hypothetical protein